jgi:hypothetical protein
VRRLFCIAVVAVGLSFVGCSDSFNPPELPDLKKTPYDFAVVIPPYASDMALTD